MPEVAFLLYGECYIKYVLFKLFSKFASFYWSDVLLRIHLTKNIKKKGCSSLYMQSCQSWSKPAATYPKKLLQAESLLLPFLPWDAEECLRRSNHRCLDKISDSFETALQFSRILH